MNRKPLNSYFSTSLKKGLDILALFAGAEKELSLGEISYKLNLNKTIAHRFTNTLVELGFLKKDLRTRQLKVGLSSFMLSNGLLRNSDVVQVISPLVDEAFDKYNATIDVGMIEGDSLISIYRREVKDKLMFHTPTILHKSAWYYNAIGKIILAAFSQTELNNYFKETPLKRKTNNTIIRQKDLIDDLEKAKKSGYSLNNEEYIPGLIALAAPLVDSNSNHVIGSVSFDYSTIQHSLKAIEKKYGEIIKKLAAEISKSIHGL